MLAHVRESQDRRLARLCGCAEGGEVMPCEWTRTRVDPMHDDVQNVTAPFSVAGGGTHQLVAEFVGIYPGVVPEAASSLSSVSFAPPWSMNDLLALLRARTPHRTATCAPGDDRRPLVIEQRLATGTGLRPAARQSNPPHQVRRVHQLARPPERALLRWASWRHG